MLTWSDRGSLVYTTLTRLLCQPNVCQVLPISNWAVLKRDGTASRVTSCVYIKVAYVVKQMGSFAVTKPICMYSFLPALIYLEEVQSLWHPPIFSSLACLWVILFHSFSSRLIKDQHAERLWANCLTRGAFPLERQEAPTPGWAKCSWTVFLAPAFTYSEGCDGRGGMQISGAVYRIEIGILYQEKKLILRSGLTYSRWSYWHYWSKEEWKQYTNIFRN